MGPLGDYPIVDASEIHPDRYANAEWTAPGVLVVWGNEPLKFNADGYLGHWLNLCVQMGTQTISIDPVLTWWDTRAEHGWWKPEEEAAEPHLYDCFGYNANNLTYPYESGPGNIGAPVKCLIAKIYKVEEGNVMPGDQVTRRGGFRNYEQARPCTGPPTRTSTMVSLPRAAR